MGGFLRIRKNRFNELRSRVVSKYVFNQLQLGWFFKCFYSLLFCIDAAFINLIEVESCQWVPMGSKLAAEISLSEHSSMVAIEDWHVLAQLGYD